MLVQKEQRFQIFKPTLSGADRALMEKKKVISPVLLSEGKVENFPDMLNLLIEYVVFFRWIYFKNRPRGNLLLLRSALVVSTFALGFFYFFYDFGLVLEGIEIDPVIALAGAVVIGYWNMTSVFHKKSSACGQMYSDMIRVTSEGNQLAGETLANTLAIELLTLDLWAHRKYRVHFAEALTKAVHYAYDNSNVEELGVKAHPDAEEMVQFINARKLQAKEARLFLDHYQNHLLRLAREGKKLSQAA